MNTDNFKDHFSTGAGAYRSFRPGYPEELFAYLAGLPPGRDLAWDCATGNGQAARMLAGYFHRVIASDASREQINNCIAVDGVDYRVMPAEHTEIPAQSVDLITVAQALHWFDRDQFFIEAKRVLKPGGKLAVWSYNLLRIDDAIDNILNHLYYHTLAPYWPPERRLVENGYRDIAFPFRQLESPRFAMRLEWSLDNLLGYLRTWSATKAFIESQGQDPIADIDHALGEVWGGSRGQTRRVTWPLTLVTCAVDD